MERDGQVIFLTRTVWIGSTKCSKTDEPRRCIDLETTQGHLDETAGLYEEHENIQNNCRF